MPLLEEGQVFRDACEVERLPGQATSDLAQLTNRLEHARGQAADWKLKRDAAQRGATKSAQDLAVAQELVAGAQASHDQMSREQAKQLLPQSKSQNSLGVPACAAYC